MDGLRCICIAVIGLSTASGCGPGLEEAVYVQSDPANGGAIQDAGITDRHDASTPDFRRALGDASANLPDYFAWKREGFRLAVPEAPSIQLAAGYRHTCALHRKRNEVRCWGYGKFGQLGYASTQTIGDDELPKVAGTVDIGADQPIVQIAAGGYHNCVLFADGTVRCWGSNEYGQLGYGHTHTIGDDETPASAGDVPLGNAAIQIAVGAQHTCALLRDGSVRCWGNSEVGRLGYGNHSLIGDDEVPAEAGPVRLGGPAIQVAIGWAHSCALLKDHRLRCWGLNDNGQLGYALGVDAEEPIGDDELPSDVSKEIELGGTADAVTCGGNHCCVLLNPGGRVRCWGRGGLGQLGYGNTQIIGDDETPSSAGDVPVGSVVAEIVTSDRHSCARILDGRLRCWGENDQGAVGLGFRGRIGTRAYPLDSVGFVDAGGSIETLVVGGGTVWDERTVSGTIMGQHTCVVMTGEKIRCWGINSFGQLGLGTRGIPHVGAVQTPAAFNRDVNVF